MTKFAATGVTIGGTFLGALAFVAACAHSPGRIAADEKLGLFYREADGAASLAYGLANSDSVGLMLECETGTGTVTVSDVARSPSANGLTLVSGPASSHLAAHVDTTTGQAALYAQASTRDPALESFRRTGRIAVKARGGGYALEARPSERVGLERFFEVCERT